MPDIPTSVRVSEQVVEGVADRVRLFDWVVPHRPAFGNASKRGSLEPEQGVKLAVGEERAVDRGPQALADDVATKATLTDPAGTSVGFTITVEPADS